MVILTLAITGVKSFGTNILSYLAYLMYRCYQLKSKVSKKTLQFFFKCFTAYAAFALMLLFFSTIPYSGKVWQGESLANLANHPQFAKLKPSPLVLTINNLLADLLFCQMLETSQITKLSPCQTFPLYSTL